MEISFDPAKHLWTLEQRGIAFDDAVHVFNSPHLWTVEDRRKSYPERRYQTYGYLAGRLMIVCWTPRNRGIHVFSMRKCNEREIARYQDRFGEA